jgi:chromosome segregation ATPase
MEELGNVIAGLQADESGQAALNLLEKEMESAESRLSAIDSDITAREEALDEMKNSIIEAMNRASDFKSSAARFDAMKNSIGERLVAIEAEAQRRADETARLREELALPKSSRAKGTRLEKAKRDLDGSVENRRKTLDAFTALREEISQDEQGISSIQSRLRVLDEMQRSREGYYASVKNILKDAPNDANLGRAIVGVVAELRACRKNTKSRLTWRSAARCKTSNPDRRGLKIRSRIPSAQGFGRATLLPMAQTQSHAHHAR